MNEQTNAVVAISIFGYKFIILLFLCIKLAAKIHKIMDVWYD
jgi:hypothetical protein